MARSSIAAMKTPENFWFGFHFCSDRSSATTFAQVKTKL
jgi:hypothetical protein